MVHETAVGGLRGGAGQNSAVIGALADGNQNIGAGHGDGFALVVNGGELALGVPHGQAAHQLNAGDLAALAQNALGRPAVVDDHTVGQAAVLLLGHGGHLLVLLQAVDVDAALAQAQGGAGHVDGCVAAADDHGVALQGGDAALVHAAQQVKAGHNAFQLLALNVQLQGFLETHGHVEGLEALFPQLLDGDVLAHFHAAAELHAHLTEHIDLGLDNGLIHTEVGDAVHQHAARGGFLIEYHRAVALNGQEVGAGHAGGAGADDGHLLVKLISGAGVHGRDVAVLRLHILLGNELLDLVDGQGLIHGAPGAGILAVLAADGAADGGEGVILLDQLQRILIAAVACHLDVALDGDVRRAGHLAGGGAGGPGLNAAVFVSVVLVPVIFAPAGVIGQLVAGILDGAVLGAQLLAQADSAGRAGLHALAAGHALLPIALCHIGGGGQVGRVEQLGGTQRIADADCAVADTEDLVLAVDVGNLVDIAPILGLLKNLHGLFVGNVTAVVGLPAVVRKVAYADAPFGLNIAGALAPDALLLAAGADGDTDVALVLLQPVGKMLNGEGLALGGDGLLNGDDVHADAGAAGGHLLRQACQRQIGHALKEVRRLGEHIRMDRVDHHDLRAAGDKHIQHPALLMVGVLAVQVLPVELHQAAFADGLQGLFQVFLIKLGVFLCQLGKGEGNALFHGQADIQNILCHLLAVIGGSEFQCGVDAPVLGRIRGDLVLAQENRGPVGNDLAKLGDFLVSC